jgi:predicted ATPase
MINNKETQTIQDLLYVYDVSLNKHPYIQDIHIDTPNTFQNIIITGKNGVGKSTFLNQLMSAIDKSKELDSSSTFHFWRKSYFELLEKRNEYLDLDELSLAAIDKEIESALSSVTFHASFCDVKFSSEKALHYKNHDAAVIVYFAAKRDTKVNKITNIESPVVKPVKYDRDLASDFLKHLANCRSQLAFAMADGDNKEVNELKQWFANLDDFFSDVFEEKTNLIFDRKSFSYRLKRADDSFLELEQLSEGYSAIIRIITEIIMRMEAIKRGVFTLPGIVLIDEIETHLHVSLQKKILSLLTKFFPNIQFIVTTHSPFVLTSTTNTVIYDIASGTQLNSEDEIWKYGYEDIVEGYFDTDSHSLELEAKIDEYAELVANEDNHSIEDTHRFILLRSELEDSPTFKIPHIELRLSQLGLKNKVS